jgi:Polyketide cyclase / dehydrase and lipid transport
MARAYYSLVIDHSAAKVWATIRSFDHYAWAGVPGETIIEEEKKGDQVGSVRRVRAGAIVLRQILLGHSDLDRAYSYAFVSEPPVAARNYVATIRVTPVTETGKAFVEWWATFDCATEDYERLIDHFENKGFAVWLSALRDFIDKSAS